MVRPVTGPIVGLLASQTFYTAFCASDPASIVRFSKLH